MSSKHGVSIRAMEMKIMKVMWLLVSNSIKSFRLLCYLGHGEHTVDITLRRANLGGSANISPKTWVENDRICLKFKYNE